MKNSKMNKLFLFVVILLCNHNGLESSKPQLKQDISDGKNSITIPALILPGIPDQTITTVLGTMTLRGIPDQVIQPALTISMPVLPTVTVPNFPKIKSTPIIPSAPANSSSSATSINLNIAASNVDQTPETPSMNDVYNDGFKNGLIKALKLIKNCAEEYLGAATPVPVIDEQDSREEIRKIFEQIAQAERDAFIANQEEAIDKITYLTLEQKKILKAFCKGSSS